MRRDLRGHHTRGARMRGGSSWGRHLCGELLCYAAWIWGRLGVAGRLCARASNDGVDGELWGNDKRMALGRAQCDMVEHRVIVGLWPG